MMPVQSLFVIILSFGSFNWGDVVKINRKHLNSIP